MDRTMFLMSVLCCHFQSWVLLRGGQRVRRHCDWLMIRCVVRVERWRTCRTWTLLVCDFVQCVRWIKWCGAEGEAYRQRDSWHTLSKKGSSLTLSYPMSQSPLIWSCSHISLASLISFWRWSWILWWTTSRWRWARVEDVMLCNVNTNVLWGVVVSWIKWWDGRDIRQLRKNLSISKLIFFICLFHSLDCEKQNN